VREGIVIGNSSAPLKKLGGVFVLVIGWLVQEGRVLGVVLHKTQRNASQCVGLELLQ
jgi:hypothetical protein